jgi:hypothetical protein
VRAPIAFVYGNCGFGNGFEDGWAAFRVQTSTYAWCGEAEKRARLLELVGALEALEADIQILRVSSRWELERYGRELEPGGRATDEQAVTRRRYVQAHVRRLRDVGRARRCSCSRVCASPSATSPTSEGREPAPREWLAALRRATSPGHRRTMTLRTSSE